MAESNRRAVLDYVFAHEGGYAERPEEGGGAVNMGITFTVFKDWIKSHNVYAEPTWEDLKSLTRKEAEEIYVAKFLTPVHFDDFPAGIDYCVYDCSVNSGVAGSFKILQKALGLKPVNGKYDLRMKWAVNHRDPYEFIKLLCKTRLDTYRGYKTWNKIANPTAPKGKQKTWGQIWTDRVNAVENRAIAMAEVNRDDCPA
ncbi:MAG TPA: glycosyl hydrolase 108 family protein [Allocoleopsis sp.]